MRSTHLTAFLLLLLTTLTLSLTLPLPGRSLARAQPLEISKREAARSSSGSKTSGAVSKIKNAASKKANKAKSKSAKNDTSAGMITHGDAPAGMAIVVAGTVVGILVLGGAGAGL